MKAPKITKVKIGSSFYVVEYEKDLIDEEDNKTLLGRMFPDGQLIIINKSLPIFTQYRALHHESTHGISYEYNFNWNENKVNICSKAFLAFIIDNPEFIREILKHAGRLRNEKL